MGKGDKRTKRGKIILGSFGKLRPKKVHKPVLKAEEKPAVEPTTAVAEAVIPTVE